MNGIVNDIVGDVSAISSELSLAIAFLAILLAGMLKLRPVGLTILTCLAVIVSLTFSIIRMSGENEFLFWGMLRVDGLSSYLILLIDLAALITVCMFAASNNTDHHRSEFYATLIAVVLGAHFLSATTHALMVFISIELVSIGSYVLVGFSFSKKGTEGSLKYFLFGATASAVMLYGLTLLYGLSGSLNFDSPAFIENVINQQSQIFYLGSFLVLAGLLFKIASFPMHIWAPDVYEAAPLPVLAFLSIVPKLAGFALLVKFVFAVHLFGQSSLDWQSILAWIAMLTITVGNFGGLLQTSVKRLMAYSSIAQSGFLLVGVVAFLPQGLYHFLFYASVYVLMNFAVLVLLQSFERAGLRSVADFAGLGKVWVVPTLLLLIGLISLTGLPPTAGFTGKLLLFSSLWDAYEVTHKPILLTLLIFGLVNTVVSLFYYLRIPYFAYLKSSQPAEGQNIVRVENLLAGILVLALLILFFRPELLMGWINKITFVN